LRPHQLVSGTRWVRKGASPWLWLCGCYEGGSTSSMAEEGSVCELERQLHLLSSRYSSDELRADSEAFCSDFCSLVEEYASRWQVPLPQLRILEKALCYFARASTFFASNCDHVLHTLSSLALSVFELLLFFDQKDFHKEPLKHVIDTFQECLLALARHQNVHLLQVERLVQGGGPWANAALQAILSESGLPQSEVDRCISSELPVFFELRVRYLLSCERVSEAIALAKCCAWHPTTGQHLFFLQVYLTWLLKTSQHDRLHKEVANLNGKDAVHIICNLEYEEKDEILLALSRAFLSQQLRKGDMYYLCDLVFIWSKLYSRLNTSKEALLEESHQLMQSATNVNSIFPFIRAILQELGEDGIQFCVELCANALESCLPCDVITKTLIYKTIAGLLPNDLEVCRACALLVFFLERTVEAYKIVYLLYMQPDQEYHGDHSPIRNHVRFETLQVLKKDLYFDPEFWNLIALRTNCLKLMSEKVVSAALEEIMEDKWILNYCTKEPAFCSSTAACRKGSKGAAKKRHQKEDRLNKEDIHAAKRLKVGPGKTQLNDNAVKRKGNQGSGSLKDGSSKPLRRSFWQLDRLQDNESVGCRRTTRLSEKNPPKRRIRTPRWLLEDSGTLGENNVHPKIKKHGLKHEKHNRSSVVNKSGTGQIKNNVKHKPSLNSHLVARENDSKHQKGFSLDCLKPAPSPQVILELSLPDNELMDTFTEDTCNRQRGLPQVLLYKPTVKLPATSQAVKTVHRNEVVLRARDAAMFVQQLHCYARKQKGKGNGSNTQGSVSTITRSSVQGSPPKDPPRELCEKPATEMKGGVASRTAVAKVSESPVFEKVPQAQSTGKTSQTLTSTRDLCEESAVEMKVTIASQTPTAAKVTQSPGLNMVSKSQTVKDTSKTTTSAEQTSTVDNNLMVISDEIPAMSNMTNTGSAASMPSQSKDGKQKMKLLCSKTKNGKNLLADSPDLLATEVEVSDVSPKGRVPCGNDTRPAGKMAALRKASKTETSYTPTDQDSINDISSLTLVTEMVTELAPGALARDLENHKQPAPDDGAPRELRAGSKVKGPHKIRTTSSSSGPEPGASAVADVQGDREGTQDIAPETHDHSEPVESEEAKLEYCCTFCNKVFKGSRVVAHAMFHYRKDECMFCGTIFKDDLLAMMHLSDHIEKLKRSKESAGNNAHENCVSETKDISTSKTAAKTMSTNVSSRRRSTGRPRKSDVCPKSVSPPDSTPSGSRKLRSNVKPVQGSSSQEKKQNALKHLNSKSPLHKVNGHIGKKELDRDTINSEAVQQLTQHEISQEITSDGTKNPRLQENHDIEMGSASAQVDKEVGSSTADKVSKTAAKQNEKIVEEKNVELQEKVSCPVDGCAWFTDLSKNRVALLYHALEDHYGEKDQKSSAQLATSHKAAETSNVSRKKEEKSQQVKTTETLLDESKSLKSMNKQIKKNHDKQKGGSHNTSEATVTTNSSNQLITSSSADKSQKLNADKMKNKAKKRFAPKENESQKASSDASRSKKQKVTNGKANTENVKQKSPLKEPESALKKPAKSKSVGPPVEAKAEAATVIERTADEEGKEKAENTELTQNSSGNSVPAAPANGLNETTAPPTTSGEKTQRVTAEGKSKKSHKSKKEGKKEKSTPTDSSDSGKTIKKYKDTANKKGDKEKRPCKDASKTSTLKKTAKPKSVDQQVKARAAREKSPDVEGKAKAERTDTTASSTPAAPASALNETTPRPTEENAPEATRRENSEKSQEPKDADLDDAKKLKHTHKEADTNIVEEKCKDQGVPSESEKSKTLTQTPQSTTNSPGYSVIRNGQTPREDAKPVGFKESLAKYIKKPYMRLPPTAYLDEKYITMPKRRKEMSLFQSSQKTPSPEQAQVTAALQRQRCAKCFATFNSAEDLQSHLQLQKCSNFFGFDSDDEGDDSPHL
ncbi:hypothetical protein L3Q82_009837, partial [Scortum barcoo]